MDLAFTGLAHTVRTGGAGLGAGFRSAVLGLPGHRPRLPFGGRPGPSPTMSRQPGPVIRPNALISVPTSFCGAIRPMWPIRGLPRSGNGSQLRRTGPGHSQAGSRGSCCREASRARRSAAAWVRAITVSAAASALRSAGPPASLSHAVRAGMTRMLCRTLECTVMTSGQRCRRAASRAGGRTAILTAVPVHHVGRAAARGQRGGQGRPCLPAQPHIDPGPHDLSPPAEPGGRPVRPAGATGSKPRTAAERASRHGLRLLVADLWRFGHAVTTVRHDQPLPKPNAKSTWRRGRQR